MGLNQSVSARTGRQQLHRGGYYSRVAVYKPLITKMNTCESSVVQEPQALVFRDLKKLYNHSTKVGKVK